ncbi:hypothetical protein AALA44_08670 [Enterococcus ratti]
MSEGVGIDFLEEVEHARSRSVKTSGEIIGYGLLFAVYHMTPPHSKGTSH